MNNRAWNILLKFVLSSSALLASLFVFDILKGVNRSDVGVAMYNGTGTASISGIFLLSALLVLSWYIPNTIFPGKSNYAMLWIVPLVVASYFVVVSLF